MDGTRFLRNKDLIPQHKLDFIDVIGLGGIGSSVIALLSIMGYKHIRAWDFDKFEEHNLSSSVYSTKHLGKPKVTAAHQTALSFNPNIEFYGVPERFSYGDTLSHAVICCPDNMQTRIDAYETWRETYCNMNQTPNLKKTAPDAFFIDCRMDSLAMELVTATTNVDHWMDHWKTDAEIEDAPCTMKHTIFTSSIIAGHAVGQVFNLLANKPWYDYIWIGLLPFHIKKSRVHVST